MGPVVANFFLTFFLATDRYEAQYARRNPDAPLFEPAALVEGDEGNPSANDKSKVAASTI